MWASMFDRIKGVDPDNEDRVHHQRVRRGADRRWRWECTCGAVSEEAHQGWRDCLLDAQFHCVVAVEPRDAWRHMRKLDRRRLGL